MPILEKELVLISEMLPKQAGRDIKSNYIQFYDDTLDQVESRLRSKYNTQITHEPWNNMSYDEWKQKGREAYEECVNVLIPLAKTRHPFKQYLPKSHKGKTIDDLLVKQGCGDFYNYGIFAQGVNLYFLGKKTKKNLNSPGTYKVYDNYCSLLELKKNH